MESQSPNQLSFLPEDYLERKAKRRTNAICGALAVLVLGAVGSTFVYTERAMREVEKRHAAVATEYNDAARRIEQATQMRQQQAQIVRRAELAATLLERVPRSNILAEFTNKLPAGVSLLDLAMDSRERVAPPVNGQSAFEQKKAEIEGRMAPATAKVYDVTLKLTGIATTDVQVAQFISQLNASPLLKDVTLLISDAQEIQGATMRRFQIEMTLDPAAEVAPVLAPPTKTAAVELEGK